MKTDKEIKIEEIKIYFKECYSHIVDEVSDSHVQLLWEILNGRSEDIEPKQCEHTNKEYQPHERDTNVPEGYFCLDCNKDLPIPEPDWDLMNKDYYSGPEPSMEKEESNMKG
jgi:hypothetical protein|tara:strand:+ start:133 stop:468 length:336 start_codon:yes stop_codon:yes gene_type:complete